MNKIKWLAVMVVLIPLVMGCIMAPKASKHITLTKIINKYDESQAQKAMEKNYPAQGKLPISPLIALGKDKTK